MMIGKKNKSILDRNHGLLGLNESQNLLFQLNISIENGDWLKYIP